MSEAVREPIVEYGPTAHNRPFIDSFWVTRSPEAVTMRVLPDGCTDIILGVGAGVPEVMFVGPMTTAAFVTLNPDEYFVGMRFKPGTLLKGNTDYLYSVRDQTIQAAENVAQSLMANLKDSPPTPENVLDYLDWWAAKRTHENDWIRDELVDAVLDGIDGDPTRSIRDLYQALDLNPRAVERRFLRLVGISPKFYARVRRQQMAIQALTTGSLSYSALAQDLGYTDQAHFINDFKALAGVTPNLFVTQQAK